MNDVHFSKFYYELMKMGIGEQLYLEIESLCYNCLDFMEILHAPK